MEYLGMEFKNHSELVEWNKHGNINIYKELARQFDNHPSMEISSMMSDQAERLVNRFGLTYDEVEQIEISVMLNRKEDEE